MKQISFLSSKERIFNIQMTYYFQEYINQVIFNQSLNKFSVSDTIIGKYNGALNLTSVKELVEYLWSGGTMDVSYSKVLESEIKEYNDYFEYYTSI